MEQLFSGEMNNAGYAAVLFRFLSSGRSFFQFLFHLLAEVVAAAVNSAGCGLKDACDLSGGDSFVIKEPNKQLIFGRQLLYELFEDPPFFLIFQML